MRNVRIKETPTNFRIYYKSIISTYTKNKEEWSKSLDIIEKKNNELYEEIKKSLDVYKDNYKLDLMSFEEFKNNEYKDGSLLRTARGAFYNRTNDYELTARLFDLYTFAMKQKDIKDLNDRLYIADKILDLSLSQYTDILSIYFNEVHKQMIKDGCGYKIGDIGWVCINRFKLKEGGKRSINYIETRRKKAQLLSEGKKLYNAEEAKWCEERGIEYDGVDFRVYFDNEYAYEYPLLGINPKYDSDIRFTPANYISSPLRGILDNKIIEICNNDIDKVLNLKLGLSHKLRICLQIDGMLYSKFIRNENQKQVLFITFDR